MEKLLAEQTQQVGGGDGAIADCTAAVGGAIVIVVTDGAAALAGVAIATAGAAVACGQDLATGNPDPNAGAPTSYDGVDCSQLDFLGSA